MIQHGVIEVAYMTQHCVIHYTVHSTAGMCPVFWRWLLHVCAFVLNMIQHCVIEVPGGVWVCVSHMTQQHNSLKGHVTSPVLASRQLYNCHDGSRDAAQSADSIFRGNESPSCCTRATSHVTPSSSNTSVSCVINWSLKSYFLKE